VNSFSERDAGSSGSRQGEEGRFATDSLLEGAGFEPSVPAAMSSIVASRRGFAGER
jgi:hypothetical protein